MDEQSAGAGTKLGNPVDEQSAEATGGSEKPGDEQSPGSTKEESVKEQFEGLPEDTLKQMLIDEIDAIPEHVKDLYARSTTHLDLVECIILARCSSWKNPPLDKTLPGVSFLNLKPSPGFFHLKQLIGKKPP